MDLRGFCSNPQRKRGLAGIQAHPWRATNGCNFCLILEGIGTFCGEKRFKWLFPLWSRQWWQRLKFHLVIACTPLMMLRNCLLLHVGFSEPLRWVGFVQVNVEGFCSHSTASLSSTPMEQTWILSFHQGDWVGSASPRDTPIALLAWPGQRAPLRPTPLHFWALLPSLLWHPVSMGASLLKWGWGAENTSSRSSSLRHPLHVIPPALSVRLSLDRCGRSGLLNRNENHIKMTMTSVGTWGTHNGGPRPYILDHIKSSPQSHQKSDFISFNRRENWD